jgi:hypothetical protein
MRTKEEHIRSLRALREQCGSEEMFIRSVADSYMLSEEYGARDREIIHEGISDTRRLRRELPAVADRIVESFLTHPDVRVTKGLEADRETLVMVVQRYIETFLFPK